jgi:hypothetical protein
MPANSDEDEELLDTPRAKALEAQLVEREDAQFAQRVARQRRTLRWRRAAIAVTGSVVLVAVVVVVIALRQPARAVADPHKAAEAALQAETFSFATRSERLVGHRARNISRSVGAVNLKHPSFRVRVTGPSGIEGFERIVFPDRIYFRHVGPTARHSWQGARISPRATIGVRAGSGGGLGDNLGLLALLATASDVRQVGRTQERHYVINSTLGALISVEGEHAAPRIAALPLQVEVWQDAQNRLTRAVRVFSLRPNGSEKLRVATRFTRYGRPTAIAAPVGVALVGSQPLNPFADDPLGAQVLTALTVGAGRTTHAVVTRAQTGRDSAQHTTSRPGRRAHRQPTSRP